VTLGSTGLWLSHAPLRAMAHDSLTAQGLPGAYPEGSLLA
jgi:hypothetical protein